MGRLYHKGSSPSVKHPLYRAALKINTEKTNSNITKAEYKEFIVSGNDARGDDVLE